MHVRGLCLDPPHERARIAPRRFELQNTEEFRRATPELEDSIRRAPRPPTPQAQPSPRPAP